MLPATVFCKLHFGQNFWKSENPTLAYRQAGPLERETKFLPKVEYANVRLDKIRFL